MITKVRKPITIQKEITASQQREIIKALVDFQISLKYSGHHLENIHSNAESFVRKRYRVVLD